MKILIVEDDVENIKALKRAAAVMNLEYDIATTFEGAIEKISQEIYYLALLDLNFPKSAGQKPERLGFKLKKLIWDEFFTDCWIVTAYDHHGGMAYLSPPWMMSGFDVAFWERMNYRKNEDEAWLEIFKFVLSYEPEELKRSYDRRLIYRRIKGKIKRFK